MKTKSSSTKIAIIGIGCIFPKAENLPQYWSNIKNGVDAIEEIPKTHWQIEDYYSKDRQTADHTYGRRGGFIPQIAFDPMEFAITPNTLEAVDTSQLLGLVAAGRALADAGYGAGKNFNRAKTSVILGVTGALELVVPLGARLGHPIWRRALKQEGVDSAVAEKVVQNIANEYVGWQENSFPGLLGNVVAGRIANHFDLGGTNCVVDAACGSSLSALHMACMELETGRSDMALSGGVDTFNDIFMYMCFSKTPALSPSGDARPFDHRADGTILGEGVGLFVLKRLDDARRDGDNVYATICGMGTSSDGKGTAVFAPKSDGQVEAISKAYQTADISPATVDLVEAHGTGTRVGDIAELTSLGSVYEKIVESRGCALGSVKSQIGHTKAAAGAAGLIKIALALHHKTLPPTIKIERPLEKVKETPFYLNTEKRPWINSQKHPRRAAVSAFGFGGSNYHCLLEEAESQKREIDWDARVQIVALAADNTREIAATVRSWRELSWSELAGKATKSRANFDRSRNCRLVIPMDQNSDPNKALTAAVNMIEKYPEKKFWTTPTGACFASGPINGEVGLIFPGQGAQYVNMLRDLACQFPQMHETISEADRAFERNKTTDVPGTLSSYIYPSPVFDDKAKDLQERQLRDTKIAQPALGAVSLGAFRILQYFGIQAHFFAGHSYGELTALCAAKRLLESDLHSLSALRGSLMAGSGDLGSMLAVQASADIVEKIVEQNGLKLVLANKNAPKQVVLSGGSDEIEKAAQIMDAQKIRCVPLPVSAAFHSELVAGAQRPFGRALEKVEIRPVDGAVFSNTTAAVYPQEEKRAKELLAGQLARPVEFVAEINAMYEAGVRTFVEVGPGKRMSGLIKAILREHKNWRQTAIDSSAGGKNGVLDLAKTLSVLAAVGHKVDLSLWQPEKISPAKGKMTVPICGANYRNSKKMQKNPPVKIIETAPSKPDKVMPSKPLPRENELPVQVQQTASAPHVAEALALTRQNLQALQKMQEQTAKLHQQFLQGQNEALKSFQSLIEQQQILLSGAKTVVDVPNIEEIQAEPMPSPVQQTLPKSPTPVLSEKLAKKPEIIPEKNGGESVIASLVEVISEKTGYPEEMLELDMNLNSDLGIDSIKRVEILSALKEKVPQAQAIEAEHMGTLKTLRDIADFIASDTDKAPSAAQETSPDMAKVTASLVKVISEKTGYPEDMLELDMNLNSDLGIDSIKRVEILSALKEKVPQAQAIEAEHMGTLKTLRDIADFIAGSGASVGATNALPAKPADVSVDKKISDAHLQRMTLSVEELSTPGEELSLPKGALVWAFGGPLARAVVDELNKRGYRSRLITTDDFPGLKAPDGLAGLIVLGDDAIADDFLKNAFRLVQIAGPALRKSGAASAATLLTVSMLDGCFGLGELGANARIISGGLAGLAKTVSHEWPKVTCKAVDISPDFALEPGAAEKIVAEMLQCGPLEVGLSAQKRVTVKMSPHPLAENDLCRFEDSEVLVISGGARGVTAECAVELAEKLPGTPTLVLLGRSKIQAEAKGFEKMVEESAIKRELAARAKGKLTPRELESRYRALAATREITTTLRRIESIGGKAAYLSVDVRDRNAVSEAIAQIRRENGPISGLIHGAGVIADRLIEGKSEEEFDRVYHTKVTGLCNLLFAMKDDDLKTLALFSSSTGRMGRAGQVDYAIANEVLNKIAQREARLRPSCRVVSVNWGPWQGGMVTPALGKIFASEGVPLIPLKSGAKQLLREIVRGDNVEVVILGEKAPQDTAMTVSFERKLDLPGHPFLSSHILDGKAVLPMAMIVEWLAHGAIHANAGLKFRGFNDLCIVKGLTFGKEQTPLLRIMVKKAQKSGESFTISTALTSSLDGKHYEVNARADIVLASRLASGKSTITAEALPPYGSTVKKAYENLLFHGPLLQGIEHIYGCSKRGIRALVKSAEKPSTWIKKPLRGKWICDPLAIDCAFQMMILWSFANCGAGSLPVFAGKYRQFRDFPAGGVEIDIQVTSHTEEKAEATVEFSHNGELVARIEEYRCIINSSLKRAFTRNRIA